jgi:hypothetical protein
MSAIVNGLFLELGRFHLDFFVVEYNHVGLLIVFVDLRKNVLLAQG